jgi:hypothetical protein
VVEALATGLLGGRDSRPRPGSSALERAHSAQISEREFVRVGAFSDTFERVFSKGLLRLFELHIARVVRNVAVRADKTLKVIPRGRNPTG